MENVPGGVTAGSVTVAIATIVAIIVEALKAAGLPTKAAPLANVVLAVGAAALIGWLLKADLVTIVNQALAIAGSSALGYDMVKKLRE